MRLLHITSYPTRFALQQACAVPGHRNKLTESNSVSELVRLCRGGVELDPTQIIQPQVNTTARVTIKPNLCLSNFTHIVVW